ncbi:MAG TPA: sugar dehydrogenase, partial [Candidatus Dormibacteraeota bacterium]
MRRRTGLPALLIGLILSACTSGGTSATPPATAKPTATPSPTPITAAGPLNFTVKSVAEGLVAPWALAFATDGSVWITERPGRVRVIRNGQLLPTAALTLNVVTAN